MTKIETEGSLSMTIDTFPNKYSNRDYTITIRNPEYTSVCPITGNPDFGTITVEYVPDKLCLELKSLKLYFFGFRNRGVFYESLVNEIIDDLVTTCSPRKMTVTGDFTPRGGITSTVKAEYCK
ncbi:MAG: preQ(1) synthase [PVC group bacterium]